MKDMRHKLSRYSLDPNPEVWDKIEARLEKQRKQQKLVYIFKWTSIAASLLIAVAVAHFLDEPASLEIALKKTGKDNADHQKPVIECKEQKFADQLKHQNQSKVKQSLAITSMEKQYETFGNAPNHVDDLLTEKINFDEEREERIPAARLPLVMKPVSKHSCDNLSVVIPDLPVAYINEQRIHVKWLMLLSEELLEEPDSTLTERVLDLANKKTISIFQHNVKPTLLQWYKERNK